MMRNLLGDKPIRINLALLYEWTRFNSFQVISSGHNLSGSLLDSWRCGCSSSTLALSISSNYPEFHCSPSSPPHSAVGSLFSLHFDLAIVGGCRGGESMAMAQSIASLSLGATPQLQGPSASGSSAPSGSARPSLFLRSNAAAYSSQAHFAGSFGLSWSVQGFGLSRSERRHGAVLAVRAAAGEKKNVLIVNTNSGGHAVIGFWTAKDLVAAGHSVTILTVGEESSDKMKKQPFSRFNELREIGVQTVWGEPSDIGAALGNIQAPFDAVLDNNGKTLDVVQPVADWAKANGAKQFLFISSAGIYKSSFEQPHVEGDAVKEDAGHKQVENYLADLGLESWASFRPQYMTGDGNNKDCEEWFFDRIARGRPVCIPAPGIQVTNISHVRDLSSMLTLAVEKPEAANGSIFNCVSDRGITFDGLVKLCAKAAGKEPKIVYYDPKAVGVDAKKAFPFRNMHFYAEPRAAKTKLGWESKTNLAEDLKERYAEYIKIGRDKKDIKFELDDKILEAVSEPVAA